MRIWLDDLRPMPEGYDLHIKTAQECIELLKLGQIDFISFDHDLGEEENGTGYDVARWILEQAATDNPNIGDIKWKVHSANPVGVKNITHAMEKANDYWFDHHIKESLS